MTAREKTYVTFTFQDREILLPSVFEASVTAITSGNTLDLVSELVPNPDQLLNDMTIAEFGDFMAAWMKASEATRPTREPTKSQRIYKTAWNIFWLAIGGPVLATLIASMFVDVWPELRYTLSGLLFAHILHVFCSPDRTP